jgi:hypothetical protein
MAASHLPFWRLNADKSGRGGVHPIGYGPTSLFAGWLCLNPGIFWGWLFAICTLPNGKYIANAISFDLNGYWLIAESAMGASLR